MRWYICFTFRRQSLVPFRCMVYSMTRFILAFQICFFLLLTSLHVNYLVTGGSNFGTVFVHLAATGIAAEQGWRTDRYKSDGNNWTCDTYCLEQSRHVCSW